MIRKKLKFLIIVMDVSERDSDTYLYDRVMDTGRLPTSAEV